MTATGSLRSELLEATDDEIEDAIGYADAMVLRGLLYQLTGDESVAGIESGRDLRGYAVFPEITRAEDVDVLRRKAVAFLKSYRDSGAPSIDRGPSERLPKSVSLLAGETLEGDSLLTWIEELALDPWARSHEWEEKPDAAKLQGFSVTVIGAGLGGLTAAVMLKRAGIPYRVIEKNSGVGGTWHENRYPGARVDTPSRSYTNIFGANYPYPGQYCPWPENKKYFDWVADDFDVRGDIMFDTEVSSLTWDEVSATWQIAIDGPDGPDVLSSSAVITAVGFLSRPQVPAIEGQLEFQGESWHTARWPEDLDLNGKRVAVIGSGCSGYQLVPELARQAEHVVMFQRTPQWVWGIKGYTSPFPPQVNWLDRNFPYYTNFMRLRTMARLAAWPLMTDIDPEFEDPHAVSAFNKGMRDAAIAFMEQKIADPELRATMTPAHPPWSARPVMADVDYSIYDAIQRDDVTLVTDGVRKINRTGIEGGDGTQYDVDIIVYATGFHATNYLFPMSITGRSGRTVHDFWQEGGSRGYTFSMIPGFPNFWMLYGPNTNGGLGPSSFSELTMRYVEQCIERLMQDGKTSIDVREDAYWRFNQVVDERNSLKAWSDPRARNYYWTEHGRSTTMSPFPFNEIFRLLRHPKFDELILE
ncbi:MAG TPA: FAD-dependent oxidoreductase [Solirubrobacteraceae bacterium]|jgi:4-hydroxyacetophenone monooxygenase